MNIADTARGTRLTAENSFEIHRDTTFKSSAQDFGARGISFQNARGGLYVVAPAGGRVEAQYTPGGMFGAVGTIFNEAGAPIARYTMSPGGPCGGLFKTLELIE